jgi:hypothetical protein
MVEESEATIEKLNADHESAMAGITKHGETEIAAIAAELADAKQKHDE